MCCVFLLIRINDNKWLASNGLIIYYIYIHYHQIQMGCCHQVSWVDNWEQEYCCSNKSQITYTNQARSGKWTRVRMCQLCWFNLLRTSYKIADALWIVTSWPCTATVQVDRKIMTQWIEGFGYPLGKHTKNYGKSSFSMGTSTISTGSFWIANC